MCSTLCFTMWSRKNSSSWGNHKKGNPHYSSAVTYFANSLAKQNTEKKKIKIKIFGTSQTYFFLIVTKKRDIFFLVQTNFWLKHSMLFLLFFNWRTISSEIYFKRSGHYVDNRHFTFSAFHPFWFFFFWLKHCNTQQEFASSHIFYCHS